MNVGLPNMLFLCLITGGLLAQESPMHADAVLVKLADGFKYTEGPCVRKDGSVVFSDMQASTIYRWTPQDGAQVFLSPSGGSNGLAEDTDGCLIIAQFGDRQVSRLEEDGTIVPLVTQYQGSPLNSPNDIAVKSDGSIYFTDPAHGGNSVLEFSGVFRLDAETGTLTLLADSLERPNGIIFSPDESILYVADTNDKRVISYEIQADGSIANGSVFASTAGSPDGFAVDKSGNLFVAAKSGGIEIYSSQGVLLDQIELPESVQNLTFDPNAEFCLYITAGSSFYCLILEETDVKKESRFSIPESFNLYQNYPNPFNPATQIKYQLSASSDVKLAVFSIQGEQIKILVNSHQSAGTYNVRWDGTDEHGWEVSSGIYLFQLTSGNQSRVKKMSLVK